MQNRLRILDEAELNERYEPGFGNDNGVEVASPQSVSAVFLQAVLRKEVIGP
jgi:hypothetical protein